MLSRLSDPGPRVGKDWRDAHREQPVVKSDSRQTGVRGATHTAFAPPSFGQY